MALDPFKLKARTLSSDVRRRLVPLDEMIRREGGSGVKVSVTRNLFESESVTETKLVITIIGLDADDDSPVIEMRLTVEASRKKGEPEIITGEISSVEVDEAYRRRGLSRTALYCVSDLWTDLGVSTITTVGIGDGRAVWARKVFGNEFENPQHMRDLYEGWCEKKRIPPKKNVGFKPYRYPKEFLESLSSVEYIKRLEHADQKTDR